MRFRDQLQNVVQEIFVLANNVMVYLKSFIFVLLYYIHIETVYRQVFKGCLFMGAVKGL